METEHTKARTMTRTIWLVWQARISALHWVGNDLWLLAALGLLLPLVPLIPTPFVRVPLGLLLVLAVPGYALAAALFPGRDDVDGIARAALSIGLSIATIPALTLLLSTLPWGIRPYSMTVALSLWIVSMAVIAFWRRQKLADLDQAFTPLAINPEAWRLNVQFGPLGEYRTVALALILAAGLVGGLLVIIPRQMTPTEFYVISQSGQAQDYPRIATRGEEIRVTVGVTNGESEARDYRVEVWVVDAWDTQRSILVQRTPPVTVERGARHEQLVRWRMPRVGDDQQIQLLLLPAESAIPVRQLHFWMDVSPPPAS